MNCHVTPTVVTSVDGKPDTFGGSTSPNNTCAKQCSHNIMCYHIIGKNENKLHTCT